MLTTLLDGRAFAEKYGQGTPAVVALHGWARNRSDWTSTLAGYDALALDLPGFGATPAPETAWGSEEYAGWLAEILTDLDRPVIVGHSFGGRVCVQLAAAHPELISGVVLTGLPLYRPAAGGARPKLGYRIGRALHANRLLSEKRMEALRHKYGSDDYRNASGVMRDVLVTAVNEDYTEQVAAIAQTELPVRMVWGERDTAAPVAMARKAADVLGEQALLQVVIGSAHLLDDHLVEALRAALDDLTGARR